MQNLFATLMKKSNRYKVLIVLVLVGLAALNQNCSKGFQVATQNINANGGLGTTHTYTWTVQGDWSACSSLACGTNGTQTRVVVCLREDSVVVADSFCTGAKPATTQTCAPGGCSIGNTGYFPTTAVWYQDVSASAKDANSDTIINWLNSSGGWGTGSMQVDFSFNILVLLPTTPTVAFVKNSEYYSPDCDNLTTFPLPANGAIEGESAYTCSHGGDCHVLVVDRSAHKLYESYQSNVINNQLHSTCGIVWDLTKTYPANGRGEQCTSTDAAGFPIAPLLFTADEVAAGIISHAIRFILPNNKMAAGQYVHPASHAGGPSGPANAVPYGAHFRLKASYDISHLKPSAQIVATALKKYGMFLADGGNIALTAANDAFTNAKWDQVDFLAGDLSSILVTDFEMVDGGNRISLTDDCVRNP